MKRVPWALVVRVSLGILALLFAVQGGEYGTSDLVRQRSEKRRVQAELDSTQRVVDSLNHYNHRLLTDPALQERIAREEFGMVRDRELLYRFIEPDSVVNGAPPARP